MWLYNSSFRSFDLNKWKAETSGGNCWKSRRNGGGGRTSPHSSLLFSLPHRDACFSVHCTECTLYSLSRDLKKFKEWSLPRDSVMNELLPKVVSISLRVFELLVPIFPRNWNYILEPTYDCEFSTSLFLNLLFKRRNGITFVAFQFWAVIYV